MIPPVFPICSNNAGVTALLGSNPCRVYPFGEAPQGVASPYATWATVSGVPENYLGDLPDTDNHSVQMDVWGDTSKSVLEAAKALRDALEPHAYIVAWRGTSRDTETKRYRFSFDVDFIESR